MEGDCEGGIVEGIEEGEGAAMPWFGVGEWFIAWSAASYVANSAGRRDIVVDIDFSDIVSYFESLEAWDRFLVEIL